VSEVAVYWTAEAFGGNGAQTMARWWRKLLGKEENKLKINRQKKQRKKIMKKLFIYQNSYYAVKTWIMTGHERFIYDEQQQQRLTDSATSGPFE
jgi:hypothetical protein